LKSLPPDKGGEGTVKEREGEGMGKEGKRTSERSHSSKCATTPLAKSVWKVCVMNANFIPYDACL